MAVKQAYNPSPIQRQLIRAGTDHTNCYHLYLPDHVPYFTYPETLVEFLPPMNTLWQMVTFVKGLISRNSALAESIPHEHKRPGEVKTASKRENAKKVNLFTP